MTGHRHLPPACRRAVLGLGMSLLLVLCLLPVARAQAAFEQVATVGPAEPGGHLHNAEGTAINLTGAGGVPAGTLYAVVPNTNFSRANSPAGVVRFSPQGEFLAAWGYGVGNGEAEYQRCGPDGDLDGEGNPLYPTCFKGQSGGEEALGELSAPVGVAVDQTTGDVYVLNAGRKHDSVQVFNADGSRRLGGFGELANPFNSLFPGFPGESIEESPEKFHQLTVYGSGIAVDGAGRVYIPDFDWATPPPPHYRRVMVFEPESPGDYEHYVYTGRAHDIEQGELIAGTMAAVDAAGDLYVAGAFGIGEYAAGSHRLICELYLPAGGITGFTVDPGSGEVFYFTSKNGGSIRRMRCDGAGEFEEVESFTLSPATNHFQALSYNPLLVYSGARPPGVLYGIDPSTEGPNLEANPKEFNSARGYLFAQAEQNAPNLGSQGVLDVTSTSANLQATVNPRGAKTHYFFQYLSEAAYQAEDPDERQSVTVSAAGGLFGLGLDGDQLGGSALGTLSSGSASVAALKTATATATLKAALGTGDLPGASGGGTLIKGSKKITSVSTASGEFRVGQGIGGAGIPSGATITAVATEPSLGTEELAISEAATETRAQAKITSGTKVIASLATTEGTFEVGQEISGTGIVAGTTVAAVAPGELTLSQPAVAPGSGVALQAGSTDLSSVSAGIGAFRVGSAIAGEGIPPGTTVTAVGSGTLTLSRPVQKPGTGVAISSPGPYPLAVGERIEGAGIAPGTTIASIQAGAMTLSRPATASGTDVALLAGLPADASAGAVGRALEGLSTVGPGGVEVDGGPGDEAGSSPYQVTFTGPHANADVPELSAADLSLSGGPATVVVQTLHDGGGGFAGAAEAPPGGATLPPGLEPVAVSAPVEGLDPDTRYRYRIVAENCAEGEEPALCTTASEVKSFSTFPVAAEGAADGRVFELVSPVQKNGGEVFPSAQHNNTPSCQECKPGIFSTRYPKLSSPDGDQVVYDGNSWSPAEGNKNTNEYFSQRTPSGWRTQTLTPALMTEGLQAGQKGFSRDLGRDVFLQRQPTLLPSAPAETPNAYVQSTAEPGSFSPLLTEPAPHEGKNMSLEYAGGSSDLSHVFFAADDALTAKTQFAPAASYERQRANLYESFDGQLRLVNVLPGNTASALGASFGGPPVPPGEADLTNAISDDGSRAFWCDAAGQVYVREDGERTRAIPDPGGFVTASTDGSKVLLSGGELFDLESGTTVDLTEGRGGFQGIAGQSEDLSRIYFVDTAVLDEAANDDGDVARLGKNNLYAWHDGAVSFIATLGGTGQTEEHHDWEPSLAERTAQASPDGHWLAFISSAPLTGFDDEGPCEYKAPGPGEGPRFLPGACQEIFLYDAESGRLRCVTCASTNEAPRGKSNLTVIWNAEGSYPQTSYINDEGRLYFDSPNRLAPQDSNGAVEDVYEFEPDGVGSCHLTEGCTVLVSSGNGSSDSNLLAVDETGKDVFFTTRNQLVLSDRDALIDLYDAREGGGIAAEGEALRPECQGEACQQPVTAPLYPTPSSASFQGAGNVKSRSSKGGCGKRKAVHKGKSRCVARKHRRHRVRRHHRAPGRQHRRGAQHNRGGAK